MSEAAVANALLQCTMGTGPCPLKASGTKVKAGGQAAATIMDNKPGENIAGFIMCTSASNPSVASALMAPQPCQPLIPAPWTPGKPNIQIGGIPAIDKDSQLTCAYGGMIQIKDPGQVVAKYK